MSKKPRKSKTLALFDVDGTLTIPRKRADASMLKFLKDLGEKISVGIVGGSDLIKIREQLGEDAQKDYDFLFAENGLMAFKGGSLLRATSFKEYLGEEKLKKLINFILVYIANLDIPIKRGTFIEFRNGMLNVSPIGRNCNQSERDEFERYDTDARVREKMVKILQTQFEEYNLTFSIGGQISFDVFPKGWDKTFCLQFVENDYDDIHFFGDKTHHGGNDYEIYNSQRTI